MGAWMRLPAMRCSRLRLFWLVISSACAATESRDQDAELARCADELGRSQRSISRLMVENMALNAVVERLQRQLAAGSGGEADVGTFGLQGWSLASLTADRRSGSMLDTVASNASGTADVQQPADIRPFQNEHPGFASIGSSPCACTLDGLSGGVPVPQKGCADHFNDGSEWCYVHDSVTCLSASPSGSFPGAAWKSCDTGKCILLFSRICMQRCSGVTHHSNRWGPLQQGGGAGTSGPSQCEH
jgi:hypothetical protein